MNSPRFQLWLSLAFACAAVTMVEAAPASVRGVAERFSMECHDAEVKKGNLDLASVLADDPAKHPEIWEKAVRRLSDRQMPPASRKSRPTEAEYLSNASATFSCPWEPTWRVGRRRAETSWASCRRS
jgi:hypothetical protein